jgi:hypothetical protein
MLLRKALMRLAVASYAVLSSVAGEAAVAVDVQVAPPAPRVVVVPPPRVGYVWAPGYWRWDGYRYGWIDGHWLRERRGWHWVPDQWVAVGPGWHFVPGHWQQ